MKINMPENVTFIIERLIENGYEAYAVGGCVRDVMLGREPEDWDITTGASPYEVKKLFKRTVDTGIKHGTVTVMIEKESYEVTTFRIDGVYENFRHPKEVSFTTSLSEDLMRRDFTINAMAYNHTVGYVDIFGGREDLNTKIIRCVRDPLLRFNEDALRILRAFRFSAQLGFTIEENTLSAAKSLATALQNISSERIREELNKLLLSAYPERLLEAFHAGILAVILPEADAFCHTTNGEERLRQTLLSFSKFSDRPARECQILCWALFLQTITENQDNEVRYDLSKNITRRLKFDNETIYYVSKLVFYSTYELKSDEVSIRTAMSEMEECIYDYYLEMLSVKEDVNYLKALREMTYKIRSVPYCVTLKQLAVKGNDLIAIGCSPGKELGHLLQQLLSEVLIHPELNTKPQLLALSARTISKNK